MKAVKDTKAPLLAGLQNYDTTIGSNIDFMKGITVEDDFDKNPKVSVDSSKVDFGKAGTYKVIYTTKDKSGNERKYTQTVIVKIHVLQMQLHLVVKRLFILHLMMDLLRILSVC